ncbi:Arginyl-tRNA--protein transferase 1 [Zalaria obscura]|uniref:Arginyl-tRNA--protein transferase 1 n=1 Tax=Zalaria obscura TaxID=2024903 RepID=A0ACC3S6I8_9PEZI
MDESDPIGSTKRRVNVHTEHFGNSKERRFPKTKDQKAAEKNSFDLVRTLHEAETENLKPVKPAHKFEVTLEPDNFTEEKFLLYQNYQVHVHHDTPEEATRNGFKRFLCSSPLKRRLKTENGKEQRLGSYHQCYRVDGRLIAMAVLDLLPHCVSGVYFVYHQDFEKWSFGKISAMREAALALEEGYEFYYMGFYIHNCVKMRYKGDYKPQYVLDPESYEWNPLDGELRGLLDKDKYVSLSRVHREMAKDESESKEVKSLEDEWQFLEPSEAADSGLSLIQIGMPGLMKLEDIAFIDLGGIKLSLGRRGTVEMRDLVAWDESPEALLDPTSITGLVAEFAACIGPELAKEVALDFAR